MKHPILLGTGAMSAMALSTALFGTGSASAGDYDRQTYADAAAAIEESGGTPVVATRIGSLLSQDECIVMNSQDHSSLIDPPDDVYMLPVTDEVRLDLNCAGGFATAAKPGASLAGPAGREAKAAAEEQELAEVSTPDE